MNIENRRTVLKGLAAGVPVAWAKPIVDSVVLPTHAATSCGEVVVRCYEPDDCPALVDCDFDADCMLERYCIQLPQTICQILPCGLG